MALRIGVAALCFVMFSLPVQAAQYHLKKHYSHHLKHSKYTHHYGRYLAKRFARHSRARARLAHRHWHHDAPIRTGGIARVMVPGGQVIAVAAQYADRFAGFFRDLAAREGKLPEIGCLSGGHMRHSLHHWGGACDVGQTARNRAWKAMYRVTDLAHQWGLTDGCEWRGYPDCGHIEVAAGRVPFQPKATNLIAYHSGSLQ